MTKKLSLLLTAAAVLAFAVPAAASASTGLTEGGVLIEVGKFITGTNIGTVTTTSEKLGNITCEHVMVAAKLTVNNTSEVKAGEAAASEQTASTCFRAGVGVSVTHINLEELKTNGGGAGKFSVTYEVELTPGGTVCTFTGMNDTFSYTPGSDSIRVENAALTVVPFACGKSATLDGSFTITTRNTTESVFLD
jgi:hypothetical protein